MATVIQLPKDTRFGGIGAGLGQGALAFTKKREEDKQKQAREKALEEVLGLVESNPDVTRSAIMAKLGAAGANFDPAEISQITETSLKAAERAREQEFQRQLQEDQQEFQGEQGELGREHQTGLTQLQISSQALQGKLDRASRESEGAANRAVQREQIAAPRERAKEAGDAFKDLDVQKELESGNYAGAIQKVLALPNAEADAKLNFIGNLFSAQGAQAKAAAEAAGKLSENDKSKREILTNAGMPITEENLAKAGAVLRGEEDVLKLINTQFGIQQDENGILKSLTGSRVDVIQAELAQKASQSIMLKRGDEGGSQAIGEVAAIAKEEGIRMFRELEWVPENIRDDPRKSLDFAVEQRNLNEAELRDLVDKSPKLNVPSNGLDAFIAMRYYGVDKETAKKINAGEMTLEQVTGVKR